MLNYQTLFEAIPGLYLILTTDFVIVAASDAYLQATMRKREEILGSLVFDAFPDNPDDPNATGVENLHASLESVLKFRQPHIMAMQKYDIRRPESEGGEFEERYWNPVNSPLFGANGEIIHIIHRVEDATQLVQLKQQEQTLRLEAKTAKADLEAVLTNLEDGFLTLDRHWCYTYINDRQLEIMGMRREDVLGKNAWEIFPELVGSELYLRFHQVMVEQTPTQFEYYYPAWNGWFENRVYPTPDGIAVLCAEISDRFLPEKTKQQIQAAKKESEARLRFVLDSSEIGEWDLDLTTQPYTAFRSLKHDQIFGYESLLPEWSYEIFLTHVHPDDRPFVNDKFQQTISHLEDWDFECRIIHSNESIHWIWVRSSVYRDNQGVPIRLLGIVVDITNSKQTEIALLESERRFKRLIESNLFGIVFGDCFGGLHYANDYLLNLVGYSLEEMQSKQMRWDELTPKEFASLDAKAVEELTRHGVCAPYEKVYLHKNGQEIPILVAAALLQEPYNLNQEVIVFVLDLSELKRVTQERDRFFNLSVDMMAIGNLEGYFTLVNPAWEKVLGFSEAELKQQPYIDFVHPDDRAATLIEAQKLAQGEQAIGFENRYRTLDGSYRWFSWNVVSLPQQNIFYAAARDISEQQEVLKREQAAREEAERANRIKDEFLAILSHELRTPLNPILGWSQMLQRGKLNAAKTAEAIAIIERNAKLQVQLINDLLDVSRIIRGKLILNATPVDIASVITNAINTVRLAAQAKSIEIQIDIIPMLMVMGDATRLEQVVWNLLSNAVKFTPAKREIKVYLTSVDNNAQIQVIDTGIGIRAEFLPYVFDRFQQEDASTTRRFGGLGLGLAIARQLVELHGGTIAVDSLGEGFGTTFTVQIPLAASPIQTPTVSELPEPSASLSGTHILVVDDDLDSREFISFVLAQEQATVTSVGSGLEALKALSEGVPHLLISDIGMPGMDGYTLIRTIRASEQGKSIPALALTAYAGEIDQQQAINAGFQRHIAKPVDPNAVVDIAIELVRGR